jgi:hypothetical protein
MQVIESIKERIGAQAIAQIKKTHDQIDNSSFFPAVVPFFLSFNHLHLRKNPLSTHSSDHPDRSYVSSQHGARVIRSCVSYEPAHGARLGGRRPASGHHYSE